MSVREIVQGAGSVPRLVRAERFLLCCSWSDFGLLATEGRSHAQLEVPVHGQPENPREQTARKTGGASCADTFIHMSSFCVSKSAATVGAK